jgi:hypothetical protein
LDNIEQIADPNTVVIAEATRKPLHASAALVGREEETEVFLSEGQRKWGDSLGRIAALLLSFTGWFGTHGPGGRGSLAGAVWVAAAGIQPCSDTGACCCAIKFTTVPRVTCLTNR